MKIIAQGIQAYCNAPDMQKEDKRSEDFEPIARDMKINLDKKYGPCWQVVVGDNFGSFVTHESKTFLFFEIDGNSILVYKTI